LAGSATWCVTGASGQLGSVMVRELASAGQDVLALSGTREVEIAGVPARPVDITNVDAMRQVLDQARPTVIVHLAAVANAAVAFKDPGLAQRVNVDAVVDLVELADRFGARLIHASTDLVFDGAEPPYAESAHPNPLSHYGKTKVASERPVLEYARGVVVRPSLMVGLPAVAQPTTFGAQLVALRDGAERRLFEDEVRTALWLDDAARAIAAVGRSDFVGLVHLAGPERVTRLEMGVAMARALGLSTDGIRAVSASSIPFPEPRPPDVSLDGALLRRTFPDLPDFLTVGEATALITPDQLAALGAPR
jgi:dTDP-4-dehydrorhamnose reductase